RNSSTSSGMFIPLSPLSLSRCSCACARDGLAHVGVVLDISEFVLVENAELAAAEGIGHGFGHFGFGVNELGAAFFDASVLLLFESDGLSATAFGASSSDAGVGLGLIGAQTCTDVFAHVDIGDIDRD